MTTENKLEFGMPCPSNEVCHICDNEMDMTSISYGENTKTRIQWKCKCGVIKTTVLCKEYDERYYRTCND